MIASYGKAPCVCLAELASSSAPEHVLSWSFYVGGACGGSHVDCLQSECVMSWVQSVHLKLEKTQRPPLGAIVEVASSKI